jgi:hypothetical protein
MLALAMPRTTRSVSAQAEDIGEILVVPSGLRLVINATGVPT